MKINYLLKFVTLAIGVTTLMGLASCSDDDKEEDVSDVIIQEQYSGLIGDWAYLDENDKFMSFTFNLDNTYEKEVSGEESEIGTYFYDETNSVVVLTSSKDVVSTFVILELTAGSLTMVNEKGEELFFSKNIGAPIGEVTEPDTKISNYGFVDLGLSVKWACCNLGAVTPADDGAYYAWGELTIKDDYTWDTYSHINKPTLGTHLCDTIYKEDEKGQKKVDTVYVYDVAIEQIGNNCRMPTRAEFKELLDECDWKLITLKNTNKQGWKIKSKKNGKSIFLPLSGFRDGKILSRAGKSGAYWSSDMLTDKHAYYLLLTNFDFYGLYDWCKDYGLTIRPVTPSI